MQGKLAARALLAVVALTVLPSCGARQPKRPLTPQEQAVQVAEGNQETSIALASRCRSRGFEHARDDHAARVRAVELGANTIQPIYGTRREEYGNWTMVRMDLRYWHCPPLPPPPPPVPPPAPMPAVPQTAEGDWYPRRHRILRSSPASRPAAGPSQPRRLRHRHLLRSSSF